jgi:hypothetical protein
MDGGIDLVIYILVDSIWALGQTGKRENDQTRCALGIIRRGDRT